MSSPRKRKLSTAGDTVLGPVTQTRNVDTTTNPPVVTIPLVAATPTTVPANTSTPTTVPANTSTPTTVPANTSTPTTSPTTTSPTTTATLATLPVTPGLNCDVAQLTKCLFTYKLACDVTRYGVTVETAKKLSYTDLHAHVNELARQDVMKHMVRNIVNNCRGIGVAERHRAVTFVMLTGHFINSFLIVYHPIDFFRVIGEAERHVIRKTVEMLDSLEDICLTIRTVPAGDDFLKAFLVVEQKSCCFVRIFQTFLDAHENVRSIQQDRIITTYKRSTGVVMDAELSLKYEGVEGFKSNCVKRQSEMDERLKVVIGVRAMKIIEDHRTEHLEKYESRKTVQNTTERGAKWTPWLGV